MGWWVRVRDCARFGVSVAGKGTTVEVLLTCGRDGVSRVFWPGKKKGRVVGGIDAMGGPRTGRKEERMGVSSAMGGDSR